jgi:hypothetical protein
MFRNKIKEKPRWTFFAFINYENPLYFWLKKVTLGAPSNDTLEA